MNRFRHLASIPRPIWALGFVSLLMDASSELVHSVLPVFMVSVLGASATSVGLLEGMAEATAHLTKIFSGWLSDYLGKRKFLTLLGYGLAALTKPFFPMAGSIGLVFAARFLDRIGKGIRGAPRDALIGDLSPPALRGACFGLRQSLDTVGAVIGPFLAMVFLMLFMGDIRAVLWVAVIPAAMAVVVLAVGVREPEHKTTSSRLPVTLEEIRQIGGRYWWVVGLSGVLALARFSEAFLVLKAQATGLPLSLVPLVMVVMSTTYALSAYPAGRLSDGRASRLVVILIGTLLLVAADIVLGKAEGPGWMMVGVGLWGLHMGFTQGLFAALVADDSPAHLRGTAFGVFYCIGGIATLLASVMAGVLWDQFGEAATFFAGALLAALAAVGLGVFCYISKEKSAI